MPDPAPAHLVDPTAIAADYLRRNVAIDVVACVSRGWNLVLQYPGPLIGGAVLIFLVFLGLSIVPALGWLASVVLNGPLIGGLYQTYIRRIRGETVSASDVFNGLSQNFVGLFLASFITTLIIMLGAVLCILPGLYFAIGYTFVLPLVIDKRLDFWPAMEVSRQVVQAQWFTILGLVIVGVLIMIVGALACLVGLVVAVPVFLASVAYAYEDLFGGPAATSTTSA
jgi:hypothetical protein